MSEETKPEQRICGAKLRSPGKYGDWLCHLAPMPNGKCYRHGGPSLGGVASPRFRNGRYSKYIRHLKGDLKKGFEAAVKDPELLSLREEAGLLTARTIVLLDKLNAAEAPPWGDAVEAFNDVVTAKDDVARQQALDALGKVIREGAGAARLQASVWAELREVIQEKAKVTKAENDRLAQLEATITVPQAVGLLQALLEEVRVVVPDETLDGRKKLDRIQRRVNELLGLGPKVIEDNGVTVDAEPGVTHGDA